MKRIAIFASGSGTNAEKIIGHFREDPEVSVELIVSNNPSAYVLTRAENHGIPSRVITRKGFYESTEILDIMEEHRIDLVVLAGFMWLVPEYLVKAYSGRMINIHPALLPKYGGRGMYGMHVHEAVRAADDKETGITIHWVNESYDEGAIIMQARCEVSPGDSAEKIADKVHQLEYEYYPQVIESIVKNK